MKKKYFIFNVLIAGIIFSQNISMPSYAQEGNKNLQKDKVHSPSFSPAIAQEPPKENESNVYSYYVTKEQFENANKLNIFLAGYLNALKLHDIQKTSDCYATNFISGDGFNKEQIINLTKQTWERFPDLKYSITIKNLRFDNNRASIEFQENITATTKEKSEITKDTGRLKGDAYDILYLERYGSGWKIVTDKTLFEETEIKYGIAKDINITFDVPEQVLAGENYTASVKVDLPNDSFALGSLTSVPMTYPAKKPEESYKQIPPDLNPLERVIKANNDCLNEIASASISFCGAERSAYTGFDIKISGIAVLLKRVNIIPKK